MQLYFYLKFVQEKKFVAVQVLAVLLQLKDSNNFTNGEVISACPKHKHFNLLTEIITDMLPIPSSSSTL